jgi:hypothetical protein
MDVSIITIFEFFVCSVPISRVAYVFIINIHNRLYFALCEQSFIQLIIIRNALASVVHTLGGVKRCYLVRFTFLKFLFILFYRSSGIQYSAGFVVQMIAKYLICY